MSNAHGELLSLDPEVPVGEENLKFIQRKLPLKGPFDQQRLMGANAGEVFDIHGLPS